jgi:thymidylate synthase
MRTINALSVQDALTQGAQLLLRDGVVRESRAGRVRVLEQPLATFHVRPDRMVLLDPKRDANPFLHLHELLWMLAGRNDVSYLTRFARRMHDFSDDGATLNGAYGYRWRRKFGFDQIEQAADALAKNPECRRQVITMWEPDDLVRQTKDCPCNLQVVPQVTSEGRLNLMVTNRSNDLVWGAFGSDSVHFSLLLQYLAARVGVKPGSLWQVSMNTHAYERHWPLLEHLAAVSIGERLEYPGSVPLLADDETVDEWHADLDQAMAEEFLDASQATAWRTDFFAGTVCWVAWAHKRWRDGDKEGAIEDARRIAAPDWRRACVEWLERRRG